MRRTAVVIALVGVTALVVQLRQPPARTQSRPPEFPAHAVTVAPATSADVRTWDDELSRCA